MSASALDIGIRDADAADLAFIVDANAAMAVETEQRTLDREVLRLGVAAVLADAQRGFYLVAERGLNAIGCLLVTREWSDWRNGDWWWLQSVYVVPAARRTGVFSALHAEVVRRACTTEGVVGLRLYVERDNHAAQATYAALGLVETHYRLLEKAGDLRRADT